MPTPRIRFREVKEEDAPLLASWTRDPEVTRYSDVHPPMLEEHRALFHRFNRFPNYWQMSVYDKEDGRLIGECSMYILYESLHVGIVIGEKERWGEGLGTEAMRLMLDFAKEHLPVSRVELEVHAENERAVRLYRTLGFTNAERSCIPEVAAEEGVLIMEKFLRRRVQTVMAGTPSVTL